MPNKLKLESGISIPRASARNLRKWLDGVPVAAWPLRCLKDQGYIVQRNGRDEINPALLPDFVIRFPSGR